MSEGVHRRLWLSYSWKDNVDQDVDFVADQIRRHGIEVHLDRFVLIAGQRLWTQIEKHIVSESESDAWAIFLTQQSLSSNSVQEEIAYALDRALSFRGAEYPLIALNPGDVDTHALPAAFRTRLFVSLTDVDWLERVVSGVEGRRPNLRHQDISPVLFKQHVGDGAVIFEIRPRAGRWYPAFVCTLEEDYGEIGGIMQAPAGVPTLAGMISSGEASFIDEQGRKWKGYSIHHNITPLNSIYVELKKRVSYIAAGDVNGDSYTYEWKS